MNTLMNEIDTLTGEERELVYHVDEIEEHVSADRDNITIDQRCNSCDGFGQSPIGGDYMMLCDDCNGTGRR